MASRISNIFPFLLITLFCVVGVEAGYLALERLVLDPAIRVEDKGEERNVLQPQETRQRLHSVNKVDYNVITRRNLFGPPPQEGLPVLETPPEELEATSLDVVLMGTVGGSDESRAIILNKRDRKQELYSVGDNVQGALIKEIYRGKVILTLDGRDEMLDMSEAAQYAPKSPSRPVSVNPAIRSRRIVGAPNINGSSQSEEVKKPTRVVRPTRRIIRPQTENDLVEEAPEELEEPEEFAEPEEMDEAVEDIAEDLIEEDVVEEGVESDDGADQFY